jgi:hypothetical protein
LDVVDDESLDASLAARLWPAVGLTVLILVALSLPVHTDLTGASPSLLHGYDLDTWGFWALAVGAVSGVWAAALTRQRGLAAAWLVASAFVVGQPLIVPAVVRASPGFAWSAGLWAGIAVAVLLLAASPYFVALTGRVGIVDQPPLPEAADAVRKAGPPGRAKVESKRS